MMNKKFIKLNCVITLCAFVFSLFSANLAFVNPAYADEQTAVSGVWDVKTPKGEFQAEGTGSHETWADGKQRFVVRDVLGHILSWGEAKLDKLTDGNVKVTVKDAEGTFETTKLMNTNANQAPAVQANVAEAPAAASEAAATSAKPTIMEKLGTLKEKVTTPIEGGGKSSEAFQKGYNFGKETPTKLVDKVKGVFTKDSAPAASETPAVQQSVNQTSSNNAASGSASNTAAKPAVQANVAEAPAAASEAAATSAKPTIMEKLGTLKEKVTTPIEGGGKSSEAFQKGYNFGKETPTKLVDKVKGVFTKDSAPAASETPAVQQSVNQASSNNASSGSASNTAAKPAVQANVAEAPAAASEAAATSAKPTIMEKLGTLKEKVTTPIEGGGKSSEAFQKGYNFGKETPTKLVDKVKGVFTKDSAPAASETPAVQQSVNQASSNNAASGSASNTAAKPAVQANVAEAPAAASEAATTSAKPTIMEKLGTLKEKVTTPIEGGGKNSEAFQKGYKFGKETPEKIVGKVKGVFTKDGDSAAAVNESASTDQASAKQTPSQKLSDPKNSKVEFNEKTGQFEKASQKADLPVPQAPQTPSKLSVALGAGKDALKSSFSVKNLAVSAGLTVGFKVLEQVKNGESISIGKAVGHLATGEFAGSFVGSGLGSAAGSVVGSLLGSTIPVVGPVLGAFMPALFSQFGGQIGSSMGNDLASGQVPSFKKAIASIDKVALIGSAAGSTIGAALGSMLMPGIGTMIGGMVGSFVGNIIVNKIRSRAKSNYNVAGVNASTNQVIFSEQIAPPPAYNNVQVSTAATGTSVSGSGDVQSTYDKMVSAYKSYSQYLAEGKGETTEGQEALAQYKQYYTEYANASGATGEGK